MKKEGYAKTTIRVNISVLKVLLERGADIFNLDSVKEAITEQKWSAARRHSAIASYTLFLKMLGRTWEPPLCKVTRKLPFIPKEAEIDALIAGCGKKTATLLQLLKETAMRAGEADRLLWTNIDLERRTITLNQPEKGGNPRIFKASNKLIAMLNALPKTSLKVFGDSSTSSKRSTFFQTRKTLTRKLQNPRLLRISLHTLRHWKATMLYHQTKDILYVKQFLGHKKIETTLLYIQLADVLFKETMDEFHVRVASKPDEIKQLLEAGFEFICEKADLLYFRKRK
jgi:integrase